MPFSAGELSQLSRLLDEAMDLPSADIEAWLLALPAEHQHLQGQLRQMLSERDSTRSAGFLSDGPQLSGVDESVAHPDDLVGPYRLIREIGSGGMGAVWLAERADGSLKRHIALKLPRLAWGAGLAERMARERDIGALLEHPNIARLYDAGVDARGRPYLALEYIDGQPLDAWCEAQALSIRQRIQLFLQVARAVAYAHGRLVVHRDLKPSNVLVTADGQAHLLDFGIAKLLDEAGSGNLTQEQGRVLTPHYASPEQISGETITVASDVYSLGALLYELLTGQHPYSTERKGLGAIEQAMLEGEPALASSRVRQAPLARQLRGEIDAILAKALRREPSQRYATADALAQDLERHLQGERVLARPDSFAYRVRKVLRRYRVAFATSGVVLLAVLGGAGVSIVQAKRANDEAERARVVKEFVVDVFKVNAPGGSANAELRQLPAEMLLERGGKLIETRFAGQPDLQAELYGVVGGIFSDMGANDLAVDYATREVSTLAVIHRTRTEQGKAMMLLARSLLRADRSTDAEPRAYRAVELLDQDATLEAEARVLLASVLIENGKLLEADHELERIEGLDSQAGKRPNIVGAKARALRAVMLVRANRFETALPMFLKSIEDATAVEGSASPTATDIHLTLARAFANLGWKAEAIEHGDAALQALRSLGRPGEIRAALEEAGLSMRLFHADLVPFEEARTEMERAKDLLKAMGSSVPASIKASVDLDLATAYVYWGDAEHADPLVASAADVLLPLAQSPGHRDWILFTQGEVAMRLGRHAEADKLFRAALQAEMLYRPNARDPWSVAYIARNLSMQGRFEEAEAVLASAPTFKAISGAKRPGEDEAEVIDIARARTSLNQGAPEAALKLAPEKRGAGDENWGIRVSALGEAECGIGDWERGLMHLREAIDADAGDSYPYHPGIARERAIAGQCALAAGHRDQAMAFSALARAAFAAQPRSSGYYRKPSEELDRLLGMPHR